MDDLVLESFLVELLGRESLCIINDKTLRKIADYQKFMEKLIGLTDEHLTLDHFEVLEEEALQGKFLVRINGQPYTFSVTFREDWIDADALVIKLNKILETLNSSHRFYWFWDSTWGQEIGFFFADYDNQERIFEFIRQHHAEGYGDQVSDGEDSLGTNLEY